MKPENTVNRSGLDDLDQHSTDSTQMWLSNVKPAWIQYEFDGVYKLHEMWVLEFESGDRSLLGFELGDVAVEYSTDGRNVDDAGGRAPVRPGHRHADLHGEHGRPAFGGVMAKFVRLTITTNWGGLASQTGLSEVRSPFRRRRSPEPAAGAGQA